MDTPYGENDPYHISTGHLPSSERLQSLVDEAYRRFRSNNDGKNSQGAHLLRPRRSDGSLHQAVLAERPRKEPCRHRSDAHGWRRSDHEGAKHDRLMKMGFRMHPKYSEPQTSGKSTLWSLP